MTFDNNLFIRCCTVKAPLVIMQFHQCYRKKEKSLTSNDLIIDIYIETRYNNTQLIIKQQKIMKDNIKTKIYAINIYFNIYLYIYKTIDLKMSIYNKKDI